MEEGIRWVGNRAGKKIIEKPVGNFGFLDRTAIHRAGHFLKSFPQYQTTPLRDLKNLAANSGVAEIYVKDESYRFGLNSFKVLGGAYAIGRYLAGCIGADPAEITYDQLRAVETKEKLGELTFTAATDGNHGRGVAWAARRLGHRAVINMPRGSSLVRLEHIKATGAEGFITDVNYDETVRITAGKARENGWVVVQDTAWEGYEDIPKWVMQGYMVMAEEAVDQLRELGVDKPTHVFIQAGVGALAGAVSAYFALQFGSGMPLIIVVEPHQADCFYRSALVGDGLPHSVGGNLNTIMAGLACGEPNPLAWDITWKLAAMFISCPDYSAANGMRILGNPLAGDRRVVSGESGAVTAGVLIDLLSNDELAGAKELLNLNRDSKILLFSTEGDTDPHMYRRIVWNGAYASPGLRGKV